MKGKYNWKYVDCKNFVYDKTIDHPEIIQRLVYNRGIVNKDEVERFMNPSTTQFYNPYLLNDMFIAVERILSAIKTQEKVVIYGDYDVDGVTSTSILYRYLKSIHINVDYYIPNRMDEGYGINKNALDIIKQGGTGLIITVDNGIAAVDEVDYANSLGMQVIVTDHHECQEKLPNALAVINPKRADSTYPFDNLAGVGVTFKLIHALAIKLGNVDSIWNYLDIVSIGTIADIVPLVDENRVIAKFGFERIKVTTNIGLRAMLKEIGYKNTDITSGFIGFIIGPRLNAAGRVDDAKKCVKLFITDDETEANIIAKELEKNNQERQEIEKQILNEVLEEIQANEIAKEKKIIILAKEGWHHGIIGIVASKVIDKFYKPTILFNIEEGKATGSARSISEFSIFDAISSAKEFLHRYGGHDAAAGLSLDIDKFENFRKRIEDYADGNITEDMLVPKLKVEAELKCEDITIDFIKNIEKLEPYGIGNPEPVFSFACNVENFRLLGKENNHLKLKIRKNNVIIDSIMFNSPEYFEKLYDRMNVILAGSLQINEWNGNSNPQILLKDIKDEKFRLYEIYNIFGNMNNEEYKNGNVILDIEKINISRTDIILVYKYFQNKNIQGKFAESIDNIINDLSGRLNVFRFLIIVEIFSEMNLAKVNILNNNLVEFEILKCEKIDLNKSKVLYKLDDFIKNYNNCAL